MPRTILLASLLLFSTIARAASPALEPGDRVAIIGDSITEQKQYSVFMEDYLLMCQPAANLQTTQFGWGGETAGGFLGRLDNDLLPFHPTAATTCYGMNDGGYSPMNPDKARGYEENQRKIVQRFKAAGVRLIVVGSPGCVDADTFHNHTPSEAVMYNKTLAAERDISRKVAQSEGVVFADVFDPMVDVMTQSKAKYGHNYPLAGGDGVHPGANGHLVMAYAMLKALGCTGNIGRITVDLSAGKAEATPGTMVVSFDAGSGGEATVQLESTRYPFCFFGDPANPDSTRGVLPWLPFNQDLNRYELVVRGAADKATDKSTGKFAARYKVTWGATSKDFSAEQLSSGINLAAEFLDNPFSSQFQKVEGIIRNQQNAETSLIKNLLHNLPEYKGLLPADRTSFEQIAAAIPARDKALEADSSAAVVAVHHVLKVSAKD